jgi:uncharacterized protein DUF4954/uncharacterized protein DUF6819
MNEIKKSPIDSLGYNFIPASFLPTGKDEYYLRNKQNKNTGKYRKLKLAEIEALVRNRNTSDNWNNILVSDKFSPELVQNCKFFGLVRIGKLQPYYLEFHNLRCPVGFYNSTIISSDFGDNVSVDNVNYLSHYIIGNDVMIVNVNELATTDNAKFGNGILKQGEPESRRIELEICNENGGRSIIPFNGMLPGDAYLWSRFRDDEVLQNTFKTFTENKFDNCRGYYGTVGDRTVIKNCAIIKDVIVGSDAYLKGANKLKNLTINSSPQSKTQIGEGCEMVNGIIGVGCRIFYGVKAVRFIMASHSQLKYGARLINSYLGNNSTISCCEVLNSLIFPAHEQHHNNSFLCAALVMGQSNMAAGATIGSNHNSRSADGEIIAGRGFWPGLCVSLKHNSKFASFIILAKGDYPAEINIPIPFCLVSNDVSKDELIVMPAYWFLYNMYALARNSWKYVDRDKRTDKTQTIEYNFLAPDSINEIIIALGLIEKYTAQAYVKQYENNKTYNADELELIGKKLLESHNAIINDLEILAEGFEHSDRKVRLIKVLQAYHLYKEVISYYAVAQVVENISIHKYKALADLQSALPAKLIRAEWVNVGGQLIHQTALQKLIQQMHAGKIKNWEAVHQFYSKQGNNYATQKLHHALAALKEVHGIDFKKISKAAFKSLLLQSITTREWMTKAIYDSRAKDYTNPFRKMVYENTEEMNAVTGSLQKNSFIKQEIEALADYKNGVNALIKKMKL